MRIGWHRTPVGRWRLFLAGVAAALSLAIILQPPPWKVFADAGDTMRVVDYVVAWSWIAAALNMVALFVLALLCPWWANAPQPSPVPGMASIPAPRWFWPTLLAAVVACSALTVPRLTQSLWDDEETSLRFYVLGRHKRSAEDGQVRLKEVRWRETIFLYDTPNNHVFHNILARLSNSAWRSVARPEGLQFKEWALRLPAFLAGLATLAAVAWLFRDVGMPLTGVLAAWLLALHPWFGKYCAEARGYTMAMLFLCSAIFCWRRALVTGRWLWWALFALTQALCLWTWPGALVFLAVLNLGTVILVARKRGIALPRRTIMSRWFCTNALAGIALLPFVLPLLPQLSSYLADAPRIQNGLKWVMDTGCYLATGAAWSAGDAFELQRVEIRRITAASPALFAAALIVGMALFITGVTRVIRKCGAPAVVLIVAACVSLSLVLVQAVAADMFVFAWYTIYLLPLLAGVLACGLEGLALSLRKLAGGMPVAAGAVLSVFALFMAVTQPARARGLHHSTEAVRESVTLTRPDPDYQSPGNKHVITVGISDPPLVYDPNLFWARSARDVILLCLQADKENRPLWVNAGYLWTIREFAPRAQELFDNPSLFTDRKIFYSEFPHCDRAVMRYVPGSITKADLSLFLSAEDIRHVRDHALLAPEKYFAR